MMLRLLSIVSLGLLHSVCHANLLTAPGFEGLATVPDGLPDVAGVWGGDEGNTVVGDQPAIGVSPRGGTAMQQFIGLNIPNQAGSNNSDTAQLVDLAPFAAMVGSGNATANAEAWFNRLTNTGIGAGVTNSFILSIRAHNGSIADYPTSAGSPLAVRSVRLFSDVDPATWQQATAELAVPTNASYLALVLTAEDASSGLPGHFADDTSLVVVPEPTTAVMLLIVAGLPAVRRRPSITYP